MVSKSFQQTGRGVEVERDPKPGTGTGSLHNKNQKIYLQKLDQTNIWTFARLRITDSLMKRFLEINGQSLRTWQPFHTYLTSLFKGAFGCKTSNQI